ncbi:MAG: hypothetical protein IPK71_20675 [Myxococcales bacterium]|nr:hypothetical protein [Myxococcales bacterium]
MGRILCALGLLVLFVPPLAGCDDQKKQPAPSSSAAASAPVSAASSPSSPASAIVDASPPKADAQAAPMPERPVPKTSPTVGAGMPQEVQMKAIAYMAAMRAPHPDDAPVDDPFVKDLQRKLGPIVLSMDSGPEKGRLNRVELVGAGRQIDLLMSAGCSAETPTRAVVQRAGVAHAQLLSHGVLVVRCNDSHAQCLQSTRDPSDVLCTTAPRHK